MSDDVSTLVDLITRRVQQTPHKTAFIFQDTSYTFRDVWDGAGAVAASLCREQVAPSDRVVLALPNGAAFLFAFFVVLRAGAVPVPLFPGSGVSRLTTIAGLCDAKAILVPADYDDLEMLQTKAARLNMAVITAIDEANTTVNPVFPALQPDSLALIYYTSGSTTDPRGVVLTHRNILANMRQMIEAADFTERDSFINPMPLYHHFSLIVMTLIPLYLGAELTVLESDFNVRRWLSAIARYRGTVTASADFAYRLCNRTIKNPVEYDLSSLRTALDVGERVHAATITDFERKFGIQNIVKPAYGLAEAGAVVSLWSSNAPAKVDERGFISVGQPLAGVEVQMVKVGRPAPDSENGEIAVRGANVSGGYFRNDEATAALHWQDGYIFTGDTGYRDFQGHLYVIGRKKNILVLSGRSVAAQEVEEIVDDLPGVRCSAVIGVEGADGDQIIVFAEVRLNEADLERDGADMARDIVRGINEGMGFRPTRVCLVKPHTISMTADGKVQHDALRESYLNGQVNILYPRS
jgi:acyl-CoA synthetase (AMP-forming)/AMP-acid ligase II